MSCVALRNAVARGDAFQFTVDVAMNPLPFTVKVNPAPPAITEAGDSDVSTGTEFPVTVNVDDALPPPGVGVTTESVAGPDTETSAARIVAFN